MKKICFIITDAMSFNALLKGQLEFLQQTQYFDITLICGGEQVEIDKLISRNIGKFIHIDFKRKPDLFKDIESLIKLWRLLISNKFDLVVYSTPKALLLGSLCSYLSFQQKRIGIVRGRAYENYTGIGRKFFQFLDFISFKLSTDVIFISESLKQVYLKEHLLRSNKIVATTFNSSNGVDIETFTPSPTKKKSKYFTILTIGRLCIDKGINELEDIIDRVKNLPIKFIIVGRTEDKISQQVLSRILENYKFVQHVDFTYNPIKYFQEADLHLFLTYREGFGNVAIEAASCAIPTFAYDVVGVRDSVKQGISGLRFHFRDNKSIAQEIQKAIENPTEFKKQFSNARDWAIENFEQKMIWQSYANIFSDIIESK